MADIITAAAERWSADYATARRRFLASAEAVGARLTSHSNPLTGPLGEALATDVASFGDPAAPRVLVMISATHGVEGFCGSMCQLDWLEEGGPAQLPPNIRAVVIHAINPHGFAWQRRVTEEGVDLNRNFVDFAAPLPANPLYAEVADAALPATWTEAGPPADDPLALLSQQLGRGPVVAGTVGGQYTHPDGLFFGGHSPTWARQTLEAVIADHGLADAGVVGVIDYHTGMGQYGYGELMIKGQPGQSSFDRAMRWYGPSVAQMGIVTPDAAPRTGLIWQGFEAACADRATFATLEYGTYHTDPTVLNALRGDHWLARACSQGLLDLTAPLAQAIKASLREAFFPDHPSWRELVLFRSRQVQRMTLAGLAAERV
ncbi:MAG: DUF2817 domain-containing protein [Alphaproteobacteria bacterium]|nr:M14 family metallopeptidase [Alphaproteobacteria bacterium]TAD87967.1 MAG: DUF2817 domain-containing protein [Alphaproteobacteria bacterium]